MSTQSIEIEYKGIKFDVEFDWYEDDNGMQHIECINEMQYKGVCFMEILERDIEAGLVDEVIDKTTKNHEPCGDWSSQQFVRR